MFYTRSWHKLNTHFFLVLVIQAMCLPPALGDDTDVFLGSNAISSSGSLPNVLFILDNSGSMQSDARDSNGVSTGQTRLEAMKAAFAEIMSTVTGVNIGLMRFNAPGGSIDYPVTNISQALGSTDSQTVPDLLISADDASELSSNGAVTLDATSLRLGHTLSASKTGNVTGFIQHQEDDREESVSGIAMDASHFNMNTNQLNGLRYYDLNIPVSATIIEAWLEFTNPTSAYTGDISIEISAQSADNPARFTGADNDLRDRYLSDRTTNTVVWNITNAQSWSTAGDVYRSPNLRDVVQEVVARADWNNNDALVLFVKGLSGSGQRAGILYRNDTISTQGPSGSNTKLVVTYTTAPIRNKNLVGIRFQQVGIPQGATVSSARINFVASNDASTTDGLKLRVRAENSDDALPFDTSAFSLSARAKTASEVTWYPEATWTRDESISGPDVTSLVQQVVSRSGWCGNNAMAMYIEPTSDSPNGERDAYAFDDALRQHAELIVTYSGGESGCINTIWSQRVNSLEDDAEESTRGRVNNSSTDLDIESNILSGIRFENIPALQGATILEAYLEGTASADNTGSMSFTIHGHNDDNANAFVNSKYNISRRRKTSASVTWTPPDFKADQVYRSPDLSAIVQEIVDRADWATGNALAFILTPTSSSIDRDFSTYDAGPGVAPKLVLKLAHGGVSTTKLTVGTHLNDLVQHLDARTYTPIVDALYEAALYYRGAPVYYGASRELFPQSQGLTSKRYKRVSVPGSYTGGSVIRDPNCTDDNLDSSYCASEIISSTPTAPVYISPINNACQNNHIVLLTDGEANNNHSIAKIRTLTGEPSCDADSSDFDEKCGRTLVKWMSNNDMAPAITGSNSTITTHTIAFNLSNSSAVNFLKDLARSGDGTFNTANTSSELTNAFNAIFREIISRNSTFTSPGATVNQFNRLTNREEIYFSVFKPEIRPMWSGNLKRYKLRGDPAVIVDANDQEAIDPESGFFKATAKSIWSDNTDGASVVLGGAASQLPTTVSQRKRYTYLSGASSPSKSLTAPSNALTASNAEITTAMLGATDATHRAQLLNWIGGTDVLDQDGDGDTTEARLHIGDPLHSVPTLVTYGGTEASPDITLFFGTNEGYIHAIDASNGNEEFAFMPEELLGNIRTQFENSSSNAHPYGIDGSIVSWKVDVDFDGIIEPNDGDIVYLYTGMRRGGRNYYGLNVTNRSQPKLLWTIQGGSGDFAQLGQTWSKPVKTKVDIDGTVRDVLVFAGGFDPAIDATPSGRVKSTIGNAIYLVDAVTGNRLWMASNGISGSNGLNAPQMEYAIPSDLSVLDIDFDGLADQIYVGDMGGQVWRFDIHNGNNVSTLASGGVIAALAADDKANARRFFYRPDIAIVGSAGVPKLAVALGSGHINEPLETTTDNRFYVLLQDDVFSAPSTSYTTLTETDLDDRTNLITDSATTHGWYITLENNGEKQLSSPLIVSGNLILTTYEPSAAINACSGATGVGRVYLLNLGTAKPSEDLNNSDSIEKTDRYRVLASPSIPPTPKLLFPEESSEPIVLVGPEQPLADVSLVETDEWQRTYWYQDQ